MPTFLPVFGACSDLPFNGTMSADAAPLVAGAHHSYYPHFLISNFALAAMDVRRTCA
jgi:hypothetical protein